VIYVFDLDNTICSVSRNTKGGWDYANAEPFANRIKKVNELYEEGHQVIIDTARGSTDSEYWHSLTTNQLETWGLKYSQLRVGTKFEADIYVDDKAKQSEHFFSETTANYLKQESGGKTNVILVNRVYKEASEDRMTKLIDEYNFINQIPDKFKQYFPKITFFKSDGFKAFYEMEHYELPTLRRLMLEGNITKTELLDWIKKVTEISLSLYRHEEITKPNNYLDSMHFERYKKREDELQRKSNWFKEILSKDRVTINGIDYLNLPVIMKLFQAEDFKKLVQPEFVGRWSHSDLHFSNILVDRIKGIPIFIDPRGYDYCDYYYDFGKLWHSVNGKYEMIATRQFHLTTTEFSLYKNDMFSLCESIKKPLMNLLIEFSSERESEVIMKTEWNEVMHFSSLIPFVLDNDGEEKRAKAAFYTSLILANSFCTKYDLI
jgi:hypothetical protein